MAGLTGSCLFFQQRGLHDGGKMDTVFEGQAYRSLERRSIDVCFASL